MSYVFDLSKLRGKIREVFGTEEKWAKAMGFSNFTQNSKLNGKSYFKSNEIIKCCDLLHIDYNDIPTYFFHLEVRKI